MGKIVKPQQAPEANAITPALPPQAVPLVEALGAMEALQSKLAAAEARAASVAIRIAPLTTALGDRLARGIEADDTLLLQTEREHRRTTAEVAGIQRLIEAQRSVVRAAIKECEAARQAAHVAAKAPLDGRLKAAATRYLGVLAEASALYFATGENAEAYAIGTVRIPTTLFDVPDPGLWQGVTGLEGDVAPVASDATMQLDAMAALIRQAQGVVANG